MSKIFVDFDRMSAARKSVEALKGMGYKNAHLDAVDKFSGEYSAEINAIGTERAPSLSALVLNSNAFISSPDKAPLVAASPMVSGVDIFEEIVDGCTRLWVTVEDGKENEIRSFLIESGGTC